MNKETPVSPWSFELYNEWKEEQSPLYHTYYDIKKVFWDDERK